MEKCPCCSGLQFNACCQPYLETDAVAPTAEKLMRSRYTAFALSNVDYLLHTHHPKTRHFVTFKGLSNACKNATFYKLKIVKTKKGKKNDDIGYVGFKAYFKHDVVKDLVDEYSYFEKIDGEWYYLNGESL